jgi:acyl-coenzyme A thioesterase PaaI-like protein
MSEPLHDAAFFRDGRLDLAALAGGPVVLCASCRRAGSCHLGLTRELLGPDGVVTTELVCAAEHEGGPGVAHGGWIAGAMDEITGHVPLLHGRFTVTGEMTVRYVKPVPIGRPLVARAWIEREEARRLHVEAVLELVASGAELARARAVMVLRDDRHFARHRAWLADQDRAEQDGTGGPA